jgi:hypothetical protein
MAGFHTKTFTVYDDYMTPKSAWEAIRTFIPQNKIIWEPFYGNGDSGRFLTELNFNVIHEKEDFFEHNKGDIVISNPPFSLKKEIVERLIELDKPFILLMPSATLLCSYMRELLADDLQIIIPRRRIQFHKMKNGILTTENKCNFDCYYFCFKMNLPRDIVYLKGG